MEIWANFKVTSENGKTHTFSKNVPQSLKTQIWNLNFENYNFEIEYRGIAINNPPLKVQIGRFSSNVLGVFLFHRRDLQMFLGVFLFHRRFWPNLRVAERSFLVNFLVFLHCKTPNTLKIFARFARNFWRGVFNFPSRSSNLLGVFLFHRSDSQIWNRGVFV